MRTLTSSYYFANKAAVSLSNTAISLASALDETSYSDSTGILANIERNIEWLIPVVGFLLFAVHMMIKLASHTFSSGSGGSGQSGGGLSTKEIVNQLKIYTFVIVAIDIIPIGISIFHSMERIAK